jgi:signal transduction histidine kinase
VFANWTLRRRLGVVLFGLFVIFASAAALATTTVVVRTNLIHDRRERLDPAALAVERLVAAAIDQETGERGFVITGDEHFLAPYHSGRARADDALVVLGRTLESRRSRDTWERARDALAAWQRDAAQPEMAAVRAGDRDEAARHVASNVGTQRFDAFRAAASDLDAEIRREVRSSQNRLDGLRNLLNVVAIGGFAFGTALVVLLAVTLSRWVRRPLEHLGQDAARVASGRLDTPIRAEGPPDVRAIAVDVEAMRTKLLSDLAGALRTNLLDVQQAERQRLAAELHDDPIQVLTVAVMRLDLLKASVDVADTVARLEEARQAVRDAIDRLRTMLFELAPPSLDRHGLARALEDYTHELFAGTGTTVQVDSDVPIALSPGVRSLAFRVAREAVANARKHAAPHSLHVGITRTHGGLHVRVRDDGRGFDVDDDAAPLHRGLEFGANLVRSAGGWWSIDSVRDEGTTVEFWLPDAALVGPPPTDGRPATTTSATG